MRRIDGLARDFSCEVGGCARGNLCDDVRSVGANDQQRVRGRDRRARCT
jgi:hypothetical protein